MTEGKYTKRLYNTKHLLRNYKNLKRHYELAVASIDEIGNDELTHEIKQRFSSSDPTYIKAILRTKGRTIIMIEHINRLLGGYKLASIANDGDELRCYNVIEGLYIQMKI